MAAAGGAPDSAIDTASPSTRAAEFDSIYDLYKWGYIASGAGSGLGITQEFRKKLVTWAQDLSITSLCDIGCGDTTYITAVLEELPDLRYKGVDISRCVIERVQKIHKNKAREWTFAVHDIVLGPVPGQYDMVLIKEVLLHCTWAEIEQALCNILIMKPKYIVLTCNTGTSDTDCVDRPAGRAVDLRDAPFYLPPAQEEGTWCEGCKYLLYGLEALEQWNNGRKK